MAAAIEILLMAPIRMRNLVSLDIEQNLVRSVRRGAAYRHRSRRRQKPGTP